MQHPQYPQYTAAQLAAWQRLQQQQGAAQLEAMQQRMREQAAASAAMQQGLQTVTLPQPVAPVVQFPLQVTVPPQPHPHTSTRSYPQQAFVVNNRQELSALLGQLQLQFGSLPAGITLQVVQGQGLASNAVVRAQSASQYERLQQGLQQRAQQQRQQPANTPHQLQQEQALQQQLAAAAGRAVSHAQRMQTLAQAQQQYVTGEQPHASGTGWDACWA